MIRQARQAPAPATIDLKLPKVGDTTTSEVVLHSGEQRIDLTPPAIGGTHKQWRKDLEANIVAMAREAAQHGVQLVVVTYPAEGLLYNQANASMRERGRKQRRETGRSWRRVPEAVPEPKLRRSLLLRPTPPSQRPSARRADDRRQPARWNGHRGGQ
jgi:hypothetical protein